MRWNDIPRTIRVCLILAVVVAYCVPPPAAQAIVIRDDVDDADYTTEAAKEPYATAGVLQGGNLLCTATLIHPEWVITAAHCIPSPETSNFRFSLGSATSVLELTVTADSWIAHPSYSGSDLGQGVDFGLIHLSHPILDVPPAQLYRGTSERFKDAVLIGYGKTGTGLTGGTGTSGVKRAAENHVDKLGNASGWSTKSLLTDFDNPQSPSDSRYGSTTPLALEGNVDAGDSGGPWYQTIDGTNYLTAITSFKFAFDELTDADYGDGSAASRVSQEMTWLEDHHDVSRFWQGGTSTWDDAAQWTDSTLPGSVNAAVISSGLALIDTVGATAEYVFVEQDGVLALSESLNTSDLVLNDGGQIVLAPAIASIAVNGNLRQRGGTLALQLLGAASGSTEGRLAISGTAEIAGTLTISPDAVSYQDPLARGESDDFTLLTASSLSGAFDQVEYDSQLLAAGPNYVGSNSELTDGLFRTLTYDDNSIVVTNYLAIEGDINGDMQVDALDFDLWSEYRYSTATDWATGDLNGDAVTDGLDFHIWNEHRFTTISGLPTELAAASVPEPTAMSAGLLAMLLALLARRPRPS